MPANRPQTKAAIFCESADLFGKVYGKGRLEKLRELVDLYDERITFANFAEHARHLHDVEVIFSTWGMVRPDASWLDSMPNLKAVFYAAGSVQGFARPLLERGILVVNTSAANAVPVAEFTLAQILLANKRYFLNSRKYVAPEKYHNNEGGRGNFGETVALLGAGQIGWRVINLLKGFNLRVVVFDPFMPDSIAAEHNIERVSLDDAFAQGYVVSNHLANLPETRGMLNGKLFSSMRQNATFINTGRGATVNEPEMIEVFTARPDLTALLDVTDPEPPVSGSPLYKLPNVFLSTHIAGSNGDEVLRMADYVMDEFLLWQDGKPLNYAVTLEMLKTMA